MSFTKGLPYGIFMKQVIYEISGSIGGKLSQLQKKWRAPKPTCPSIDEGIPLNYQKLISIFILALIGIFLAFIILIIEKIWFANSPKKYIITTKKEANKKKIQDFFTKLQANLNNDDVFLSSTITTRSLVKEIQNQNELLNNTFNTEEEGGSVG